MVVGQEVEERCARGSEWADRRILAQAPSRAFYFFFLFHLSIFIFIFIFLYRIIHRIGLWWSSGVKERQNGCSEVFSCLLLGLLLSRSLENARLHGAQGE
jgi:hypothetical protein